MNVGNQDRNADKSKVNQKSLIHVEKWDQTTSLTLIYEIKNGRYAFGYKFIAYENDKQLLNNDCDIFTWGDSWPLFEFATKHVDTVQSIEYLLKVMILRFVFKFAS